MTRERYCTPACADRATAMRVAVVAERAGRDALEAALRDLAAKPSYIPGTSTPVVLVDDLLRVLGS